MIHIKFPKVQLWEFWCLKKRMLFPVCHQVVALCTQYHVEDPCVSNMKLVLKMVASQKWWLSTKYDFADQRLLGTFWEISVVTDGHMVLWLKFLLKFHNSTISTVEIEKHGSIQNMASHRNNVFAAFTPQLVWGISHHVPCIRYIQTRDPQLCPLLSENAGTVLFMYVFEYQCVAVPLAFSHV